MDPLLIFGIELGQWRRRNRLSSAALAARLGVTAGSVARIETGGQNISVKVFSRLPEEMKSRYRGLMGEPIAPSNGQRRTLLANPEQVKRRKCLGCRKQFTSMHYGNRSCPPCADRLNRLDDGGTYRAMTSRKPGVPA